MLDDELRFCMPIDIISLSNFEDSPIVILLDIGLDGEIEITFFLFSCLGLGVKSVSECISTGWSKQEESRSVRRDVVSSSYKV